MRFRLLAEWPWLTPSPMSYPIIEGDHCSRGWVSPWRDQKTCPAAALTPGDSLTSQGLGDMLRRSSSKLPPETRLLCLSAPSS